MQCEQIQAQLDDYIDGHLDSDTQQAIARHVEYCDACQQELQEIEQLQQRLRALPVPPPNPEFAQRVFASLEKPRTPRWEFAAGFGTAIAASVAVWFIVSSMVLTPPVPSMDRVSIQLVPEQTQKVNVVFNSPIDIQQATLSIELPDNVEVSGYPGKRSLQWQTPIRQGINRLRLPLILHGQKNGRIVTHISDGIKSKTFFLDVDAAKAPSVYLSQPQSALT